MHLNPSRRSEITTASRKSSESIANYSLTFKMYGIFRKANRDRKTKINIKMVLNWYQSTSAFCAKIQNDREFWPSFCLLKLEMWALGQWHNTYKCKEAKCGKRWKICQTGDHGDSAVYTICAKCRDHPAGGPIGFHEYVDLTVWLYWAIRYLRASFQYVFSLDPAVFLRLTPHYRALLLRRCLLNTTKNVGIYVYSCEGTLSILTIQTSYV